MRLKRVHQGHRLPDKFDAHDDEPDRGPRAGRRADAALPERFFGHPFSELTEQVMRGPSEWAVGEREMFAAFVSRLNQCVF